MATFRLSAAGDTFDFDLSGTGTVRKNGNDFGTWSTNRTNQIVVNANAGTPPPPLDVTWRFNEKNELTLSSDQQQICNFHDAGRPRYDLLDAVLKVRPSFSGAHQFDIHGEWDLDETHLKLSLTTPDNTKSTIDGSLNDLRSRFVYRFASLTPGREDHTALLLFSGTWSKDPNDPAKLNFAYRRERQPDGTQTEDVFVLPGNFEFNSSNQLIYRFANGKHQIAIVGSLRVSPSLQITYSIANQVSSDNVPQVRASDIVVDAVFANPSFTGSMQLAVNRPGGGQTVFSISGKFTHVRKSGTQIGVGFSIAGGSGATPAVVAFQGTFSVANNETVSFTFERNASQMTITFAANQIRLGGTLVNASATITTSDGKLKSVEAMFGINFPQHAIGVGNA